MKNIVCFLTLFMVINVSLVHAQQRNTSNSLFSDYKAHRLGDIVRIHIVEISSGSNSSSTNSKSENELNASTSGSGAMNFIPIFGFTSKHGNEYKGDGRVSQKGKLRAKMSARIIEVSRSGNLKIQGQKILEINGDKQTTILTGWVRPEDITTNNIVYSYDIADAEIRYKGKGVASSGAKPGWLTKLINWIF